MVHSLRKYVCKRGSALFMVISTMTALMVTCMAMFFSVVSARDAQYAVFNEKQAYQSGISIADTVLGGLKDGTLNALLEKMGDMEEGDVLSTNGNGFASMDPSGTKEDVSQMGAYNVDITRLGDETIDGVNNMTFDIATTTLVNGAQETTHMYIHIAKSEVSGGNVGDANIFAATGYVPNDAYLDGGYFITDVFFDTQYTVVNSGIGGKKDLYLGGNLSCGGSINVNNYLQPAGKKIPECKKATTWAIRDTYYVAESLSEAQVQQLYEGSNVFVGGNMIIDRVDAGFKGIDLDGSSGDKINVYIRGNLVGNQIDFTNCNVFVKGNINVTTQIEGSNHKIYCNGSSTVSTDGNWSKGMADNPGCLSYSDFKDKLDEATTTRTYYKWELNDSKSSEDDYIPELDESQSPTKITIKLNSHNEPYEGVSAFKTVYTIAYPGSSSASTADVECKGGIIEDCIVNPTMYDSLTIVIDTGEDEDNIMYFRIKANCDSTGNVNAENKDTFSWFPPMVGKENPGQPLNILVKGRGSVVIDIPEGVTYQDVPGQQFMHYSWFNLLGGEEGKKTANAKLSDGNWGNVTYYYYNSSNLRSYDSTVEKCQKMIHTDCSGNDPTDHCTLCTYTDAESSSTCPECGTKKHTVTCDIHGDVLTYCPSCKPKGFESANCSNHVGLGDNGEVKKFISDNSLDVSKITDSEENLIFPHTNIYLISCAESADVRFCKTRDDVQVKANAFYGYVYAPYMTFKAEGNSGGGNRFLGGLTVSDFILNDTYAFTACYPEKMPQELMGEDALNNALNGLTSKSWKISLGSY